VVVIEVTAAPPAVVEIIARPEAIQGELIVTTTPVEEAYSVPVRSTMEIARLVLPPAEREVLVKPMTPLWKPPPVPLPIS
jgi:hypothetical protein